MKQTVYITSPQSQQIHVWNLNNAGILTLVQVVDVPGQVHPIVISPDTRFLYVGVRPEFRILAYSIAPDNGALIFTAAAPLPGRPTHMSTDRKGNFIFSSSYTAGCVSVTSLRAGIPMEPIYVVEGLEGCHSANITPNNRTLWVPVLKQDRICLFTLSDNGCLVAHEPAELATVEGAGPRHMVFHPNQNYAYVLNELHSSIDVWKLQNTNGQIKCIQTLDIMMPDFSHTRWAADIHITPNGRYLYACDRTASMITMFSVLKNGSMLVIEGYQPTETQPCGFNIDFYGKYLIAAGQKSNRITVYEIKGKQGLLKEKGRYMVGQGPTWVVIKAH